MLDTLIGYHHAMSKIHRAGITDMVTDMDMGMVTDMDMDMVTDTDTDMGMVTDMVMDMGMVTLISHNPPIADLK